MSIVDRQRKSLLSRDFIIKFEQYGDKKSISTTVEQGC